jgi:hypothetical protein
MPRNHGRPLSTYSLTMVEQIDGLAADGLGVD